METPLDTGKNYIIQVWMGIFRQTGSPHQTGLAMIGARAGELIAEAAAAINFGASSEDIARTCHAHPTLAEAVKEAAMAVEGRAIHF